MRRVLAALMCVMILFHSGISFAQEAENQVNPVADISAAESSSLAPEIEPEAEVTTALEEEMEAEVTTAPEEEPEAENTTVPKDEPTADLLPSSENVFADKTSAVDTSNSVNMLDAGLVPTKEPEYFSGTLIHEGPDYTVTAEIGEDAQLPEEIRMRVEEIQAGTDDYKKYLDAMGNVLEENEELGDFSRFFDISFVQTVEEDGEEKEITFEPAAEISVQVIFHDPIVSDEETAVRTVQFDEFTPEIVAAEMASAKAPLNNVDAIDTVSFFSSKFSVYGFFQVKKVQKFLTLGGDSYSYHVNVSYDDESCSFPLNATLEAREISETDPLYDAYRKQAAQALEADDVRLAGLFDIGIYQEDGEKLSLSGPVNVTITLNNGLEDGIQIVHFKSAPEPVQQPVVQPVIQPTLRSLSNRNALRTQALPEVQIEEKAEENTEETVSVGEAEVLAASVIDEGTAQFTTDSFSVFALAYTVDFAYDVNGKEYEYSLPGGGFITLPQLLEVLGFNEEINGTDLDQFIADIENVEFSSPELVWTGKVEEDTTVGQVKTAHELECEYSAELTAEQIEEINSAAVSAGEWLLISLKAFTSEETLTVTMKDGEVFTILVTDAQIKKTVMTRSGEAYEITVTFDPEKTGIPEDAELEVMELLEGEDYTAYVARTEDALGMEEGSAGYIRLFDIRIVDENGEKIQPAEGTAVDVRIALADTESDSFSVVHFADDSDNGELVDAKTDGHVISFAADGFSVYSVVSQENATGTTALDGKTYVLVTRNNCLLMGEEHASYPGRLSAKNANPTVGGTLQVTGTVTMWTFEAVPDQPGWYYISDGNGHYLNITSASGDGGTVTLGEKQAIYVASKQDGSSIYYQLRNGQTQNGSKAVNNYGNNVNNGFGAWKSSNATNDWFRLYDMEFLGDYNVSFNANGGSGAAPAAIWGLAGDTITLPVYNGTRAGYTFLGWSTGSNVENRTYYPVYPAGSAYSIPDENTSLYAIWTRNDPVQGQFFIRLDGTIPYEPDQYESTSYTSAINITGAIKKQMWVTDNDVNKPNNGLYVENNVTAELNQVPDAAQLVNNINGSQNMLGFRVINDDGEISVSEISNAATNAKNYNVSVGDKLYVLWYVQKYAGSWHVDGTLLVKNKVNISYDGNAPDGSVKNVPLGYQEAVGTVVPIGASGSKNGQIKTPTRPGYIFLGWNLKPDGSGTAYNNYDTYTLNNDTTFYAQWSKGKNLMTVAKTNDDGETLAGAQFKLEEKTSTGSYIEKANRTTGESGTFTYDQMENDTLYRMTETYAPNGYEIQNAFFFKVSVDGTGSDTLKLHVCDENGHFIEQPNWLTITYIPAEDPSAQGVARIRFNIKDERIKRSIKFIKVDEEGNPLSGAEYTLKNSKGIVSGVLKEQSGSDGVFSVENAVLPYGTYILTESKSPETFAKSEPVTFTLNDYVSETNNGLTINEDRSGSVVSSKCEVSSVTEQGLTITTYAYTVKVKDEQQAHIIVTKNVEVDGDLNKNDLNTTVYYALTKKGEDGYVTKEDGSVWIESMNIVNGVLTPERVVFDGIEFGEYDVWEMALINGEYTRMYNGLVVDDTFQLNAVSASSADGGNNANVSAEDLEAQVDFTNRYGKITQSTSFIANKRWTDRAGNEISPPKGATIEFTLYSEKKDADGQIIENTQEEVRSIELDGIHDPEGEDMAWQAVFKYLPVYYEGNLEYSYKVKETVTVEGYYPNNYPQEYYLTSSGGTITNRRLTTDVEIHKHFELSPTNTELMNSNLGLSFTLIKPDGTEETHSLSEFSSSSDDTDDYVLLLKELPLGEYSLTESGQNNLFSDEGYKLVYSVSSAEGESEVGGIQQPVLKLELQNSYAKSGTLVIKKNSIIYESVDEQTVPTEISGKRFSFVVKRGSLYLQENSTLGTTPFIFSLKEHEFREFTGVPTGQYTVIEQDASVEGYLWEVVDGTRNVADGTWSKELTITEADSKVEAVFDNRYTKIESGSLTVSKCVVGGPDGAQTKEYKVEIKTTRHGESVWLDDDGNLKAEKTILSLTPDSPLIFPDVPAGTYIVTENEEDAAFEDYALAVTYDATYTAAGEEDKPSETPLVIHRDGHGKVSITNAYTYLYTPVKITKTVTGNRGDQTLYFGFDVYLSDTEDHPIVIENVTDQNGKIQFSLKHGEEKLLEKLPKGAKLVIVEHNEHYKTTVSGKVGVGEGKTEMPLAADETHHDEETETTDVYTFVIPEAGATVDFINDRTVEQSVVLKKIGFDNRNERTWNLAGATFRIYEDAEKTKPVELDGKPDFTSGEDGVFYSGKLGAGTYYLDETVVPGGYIAPSGMYVLRVSEGGVTLDIAHTGGHMNKNDWITQSSESSTADAQIQEQVVYTIAIRNTVGVELPATGGKGVELFYLSGGLMILLAGLLLRRNRRKV